MTSNIGSQAIMDPELKDSEREEAVTEAMRLHFRPEFLNRIDEVVIFKSLGAEQLGHIVRIQLEQVVKRLEEKKIAVEFDARALDYLGEKGFDPVFGARPLKRVIQAEVLNPLAKEIIAGRLKAGDKAMVSSDGTKVIFKSVLTPSEGR
jgi:ATP-dependent Clp protease ATP-binding subunit ClpB